MRHVIVSYDAVAAARTNKQLMAFLTDNRHISSWSKPFDGLIILKSVATLETLTESLKAFFEEKVQFIVADIAEDNSIGNFIEPIWQWIADWSVPALAKPAS